MSSYESFVFVFTMSRILAVLNWLQGELRSIFTISGNVFWGFYLKIFYRQILMYFALQTFLLVSIVLLNFIDDSFGK